MGKGRQVNFEQTCAGICVFLTVIFTLGLYSAFSSVQPNEVGIRYSWNTISIEEDKIYASGRYFLGIGNSFIPFPKTSQLVRFSQADGGSLNGRTADGLLIEMDISFQYQLLTTPQHLIPLYLDYGENPEVAVALRRIAKNVIRVVASQHDAFSFFYNRSLIQMQMQTDLKPHFEKTHAMLKSVQFLGERLPERFDAARTKQEVAMEKIETSKQTKGVSKITSTTRVSQAQKKKDVILLNANAQSNAIKLDRDTDVVAIKQKLDAEAAGYRQVYQELGFTERDLLDYITISTVKENSANKKVINFPKPDGLTNQ